MPDTAQPTAMQRFNQLCAALKQHNVDAFILPRFDAHQGEYVAPHDQRLRYITGFSGSAGVAIVTQNGIAMFVDGRYSVQVRKECAGPIFSYHHLFNEPPEAWIAQNIAANTRIGFDAMHIPPSFYDNLAKVSAAVGATLYPLSKNPVDAIWGDQPAPPSAKVAPFPSQFSGQTATAKRDGLLAHMAKAGARFYIDTQPDNIAWFLNVRGNDVVFNPMPHSFLIADDKGGVDWFINPEKLDDAVRDHLPNWVRISPQTRFLPTLTEKVTADDAVLIDPEFSPIAARLVLETFGGRALAEPAYLTLAKARKNATELEGMRACHIQDGVAVTEFSAWLTETVPVRAAAQNPLTEREAEDKILELRKARPGFLSESFNSISAAGSNAAMCHYATTPTRNAPILPENTYLLDSGGQYETGTTDITRSFNFGTRPAGYDRAYTAVLKALIALATLRFPTGTQGHHIDAICRRPLWELGLDYDHGTGHGVGHRLSVHEHPQRIGKAVNPVDLAPGIVLSIEPGHYVESVYGIRIENLFEIVLAEDGFMEFRNLTWAPIQKSPILRDLLSDAETEWLAGYNRELATHLKPMLSKRALSWLEAQVL